jgi:thiol:disulfide interchange protein DsbD
MLSPDEQLLTHPVGYTPKVEEYEKWLNCGIDAYKELQAKGK